MIQGRIWGKVYIIIRTTICWLKQERKTCESPKGGIFFLPKAMGYLGTGQDPWYLLWIFFV